MKLALIILVAVLLLGGGSAAGWWFVYGPGAEQPAEAEPTQLVPGYLALDPIVLPIIQGGRVTAHITYQVTVELEDVANEADAELHKVRVTDAVISEMHGLFGLRLVREQGYESGILRQRVLKVARDVLAPILVSDIYIRLIGNRDQTTS